MNEPILFPAEYWNEFKNSEYYTLSPPYGNPIDFFSSYGAGVLTDCVFCLVTEERNNKFELEMTYPVNGKHYDLIELNALIKVKARPSTGIIDEGDNFWEVDLGSPQLFFIYEISEPMFGTITIKARHISYILSGIPSGAYIREGVFVDTAMVNLRNTGASSYVYIRHPFYFRARFNDSKNMSLPPSSVRNKLLGLEGSILDTFGGEYLFDNFQVILYNENKSNVSRGADRGVVIEYGKNLQTFEQDKNCAEVYTHIYPYFYERLLETDTYPTLVEIAPSPVTSLNNPNETYANCISVDLTQEVLEVVNLEQYDLSTQAGKNDAIADIQAQLSVEKDKYINAHSLTEPKVSLTVSFAQLGQYKGYEDTPFLDRVGLCDTIRVRFPRMGIDVKTKIVKVVYNPLFDRVESVDIGTPRKTIVSKR